MPKYKVEWYIDYPGLDGIREMEIEDAKDEEDAREQAIDIILGRYTIGEVNEIK